MVSQDFKLPPEAKRRLARLLDPPLDTERDWRGLGKRLAFDRYLQVSVRGLTKRPTSRRTEKCSHEIECHCDFGTG